MNFILWLAKIETLKEVYTHDYGEEFQECYVQLGPGLGVFNTEPFGAVYERTHLRRSIRVQVYDVRRQPSMT